MAMAQPTPEAAQAAIPASPEGMQDGAEAGVAPQKLEEAEAEAQDLLPEKPEARAEELMAAAAAAAL